MPAVFQQVVPVLSVRDVGESVHWYRERLGFALAFIDDSSSEGDTWRYVGLRRDDAELHLQWHHGTENDPVNQSLIRFIIDDPDALYAEFAVKHVFHAGTALRNTAWGTREFGIYDPDRNGLIFFRDFRPGEVADAG